MKTKVRSIFISDVHIGTRHCKAKQLIEFLKNYEYEHLYLIGDIFDGYAMRTRMYWNDDFSFLIRYIIGRVKHGVKVTYISGNHDDFLRKFEISALGHIHVTEEAYHESLRFGRILLLHGDQFDLLIRGQKWLYFLGSIGYTILLNLNPVVAWLSRFFCKRPWSLSKATKAGVKRALSYIQQFAKAVAHYAAENEVSTVIAGHIHTPSIQELDGITYFNCGDWMESCSALIERKDGVMVLVHSEDGRITEIGRCNEPFSKGNREVPSME